MIDAWQHAFNMHGEHPRKQASRRGGNYQLEARGSSVARGPDGSVVKVGSWHQAMNTLAPRPLPLWTLSTMQLRKPEDDRGSEL